MQFHLDYIINNQKEETDYKNGVTISKKKLQQ